MQETKKNLVIVYLAMTLICAIFGLSFIIGMLGKENAVGITGYMAYYPYNETWWNDDYRYRISVNVSSGGVDRNDYPIELDVDFTEELQRLGSNQGFDLNSVRVIEHDPVGYVFDAGDANLGLPSQFEPDEDFDPDTNAKGKVVWIMDGETSQNSIRYFYIYFDTIDNPHQPPNYQGLSYSFNQATEEFTIDAGDSTIIKLKDGQPTSVKVSGREQIEEFRIFDDGGSLSPTVRAAGPVRIVIDFSSGSKSVTNTIYHENFLQINDIHNMNDYKYLLVNVGGDSLDGDSFWTDTDSQSWSFGSGASNSGHVSHGWFSVIDTGSKDFFGGCILDHGIPETDFHTYNNYNGEDLIYMWQSNVNGADYYFFFRNIAGKTSSYAANTMDDFTKSHKNHATIMTRDYSPMFYIHPKLFFSAGQINTLKQKTTDTDQGNLGTSPNEIWNDIKNKADSYANQGNPSYDEYSMRDEEERLLTLSFAYVMTEDDKYLTPAKSSVNTILSWENWEGTYYFGHKSICRGMAYAYDMLFLEFSEQKQGEIRQALIDKCIIPLYSDAKDREGYFSVSSAKRNNNFHVNYVGGFLIPALAVYNEDEHSSEWGETGRLLVEDILDNIGENGGWREGLQYGTSSINWLLPPVYGLKNVMNFDYSDHERLNNLQLFSVYQTTPDGGGNANFGETLYSTKHSFSHLANYLSSQNENTISGNVLKENNVGTNVLDFVWYEKDSDHEDFSTLPYSRNFRDVSWQFSRSGWRSYDILLGMKDDHDDVNHGSQNDCNHYILNVGGDWLASDQGKHLGSTASYKASTIGHNTLIVDNDEDSQKLYSGSPHCYNEAYFGSDFFDYIVGDAKEPYHENGDPELERFDRHLVFVKPDYLVVFDDIKTDGNARDLKILHHLRGGSEPVSERFEKQENKIKLQSSGYRGEVIYNVLEPADFNYNVKTSWNGHDLLSDPVTGPYMEIFQNGAKTSARFLSVLDIQTSGRASGLTVEKSMSGSKTITTGDFDSDGRDEIAVNRNGLRIIDYSGGDYTTITQGDICTGPKIAAGDIDNDGYNEIICPVNDNNQINIVGYSGSQYIHEATLNPGRMIVKGIAVEDIDHDTVPEIVIGDNSGYVKIIDFSQGGYNVIKSSDLGEGINDLDVGDVDQDGAVEIVLASDSRIRVINTDLGIERQASVACNNIKTGNLDFDDYLEITCDEEIYQYDGSSISKEGEISSYALTNIELADVDGSGRLDIIKTGSQSVWSMVEIYDLGYSNYRKELENREFGDSFSGIATGYLDDDENKEIIIGSDVEGKIVILSVANYGDDELDIPNTGGFENAKEVTKISGANHNGARIQTDEYQDIVIIRTTESGSFAGEGVTCNGMQCMLRTNLHTGRYDMFGVSYGTEMSYNGQNLMLFNKEASGILRQREGYKEAKISAGSSTNVQIYSETEPSKVYVNGASKSFGYSNKLVLISGISGDAKIRIAGEIDAGSAPYFSPPLTDKTAAEDSQFTYDINAVDDDGDNVVFSDNTNLFNINRDSGMISFVPSNNKVGSHDITITISDGMNTATDTFRLTVTNVNDPPTKPSLSQPSDNSVRNSTTVYFSWMPGSDIDAGDSVTTRLIVRNESSTVYEQEIAASSKTLSLADNTRYHWKVISEDMSGAETVSDEHSFVVDTGAELPFCGDGNCDSSEDCNTCEEDCGACQITAPVDEEEEDEDDNSGSSRSSGSSSGGPSNFAPRRDVKVDTKSYDDKMVMPEYTDKITVRPDEYSIDSVDIKLSETMKNPYVEISVSEEPDGDVFYMKPGSSVYNYIELSADEISDDLVLDVEFSLNVNKRWIENSHSDLDSIRAYMLDDEEWKEVGISLISEDSRHATYKIDSEKLGNFVIVAEESELSSSAERTRTITREEEPASDLSGQAASAVAEEIDKEKGGSAVKTILVFVLMILIIVLIVPVFTIIKKKKKENKVEQEMERFF